MVNDNQLTQLQTLVHQSDSTLAVSLRSAGGVLLKGRFFDDIIFPGASLVMGSQFVCKSVQAIGKIKLIRVEDTFLRQQSRRLRIQDIAAMQRILKMPNPRQRACLVVNLFCRRLGLGAALTLDPEIVARMVFTDVQEVVAAYRSYEKSLSGLVVSGRLGRSDVLSWQRRLDERPAAQQFSQAASLSRLNP